MNNKLKELERQEFNKRNSELCLIPSEGFPSEDVLQAQSSIFSLKYAEGRSHKRYYCGCEVVDEMVDKCEESVLKIFNAQEKYNACCELHSGTNANLAIYGAILNKDDVILAPDVASMGHISHSHPLSFIGKYHNVVTYGLDKNGFINYDDIRNSALKYGPKLIIAGTSAYSREIDFKKIKEIADIINAYTMADIAHITTLVATGEHQSPVDVGYDFISFTTHKMLNGPRGACVLYKKEFEKEFTRGLIPFSSGGPLENMVYAKLVRFDEILNDLDSFKQHAINIKDNARVMAETFKEYGIPIISNGTDNHLMLLDLSEWEKSGRDIANLFEQAGVICNCNAIPNDPKGFFKTSGIRLGTPFITTRGLNQTDCKELAEEMSNLLLAIRDGDEQDVYDYVNILARLVSAITSEYPLNEKYFNYSEYLFGN